MSLFLLSGFEARLDENSITGLKTDKARALLAYLAIERNRPHRRQALAGLFWPGYLESSARANLRHALANLRQVLSDNQANPPFLLIKGETIQLNPAADIWVDVWEFNSSISNPQSSISNLQSSVSLYCGAFLEGFSLPDSPEFDTWLSIEREALHRQVLSALYQLAEENEKQGQLEEAIRYARRQLELEPAREEAHRQLMRLLAQGGQRTAALAQYETCWRVLMAELDVEPSPETTKLYDEIRAGLFRKVETVPQEERRPQESLFSTANQPKHNLPVQLTRFIGREKEVSQVQSLLETHRLVTLTGSGGVGKTRLSVQVGEEVLDRFKDGVWFVDLAPLSSPEQVPSTVARVLGVSEDASRSVVDSLTFFIKRRELFLVLDNCEHLLQACGNLAEAQLRLCPTLKIMASSREPLGVVGEALYRVPSLSYPEGRQATAVEGLLSYSAVELLVERVRLLLPDYQVTGHNAAALARICQQLNGIPLALELAAARFGVLTAEQVAARLEDAFRLLTGGTRIVLPRHQTLRAAIDWSYSLLGENERLLLHRLPAFAAGFTLEAAEAVCAGDGLDRQEVLDLLTRLVNKSLVVANRTQGEEARYQLLETVRQYAQEKLLAAGESQWLSNRHCEYYLWLAEQAEPRLKSAERLIWTRRLILEHHNMHQALEWTFNQGDPHAGLRIIVALALRFWQPVAVYQLYGSEWVRRGIEFARSDPNVSRLMLVRLLNRDPLPTEDITDEIITLCEQIGPQADVEYCVALISKVFFSPEIRNAAAMHRYIEQCLEAIRGLDPADSWNKAFALTWLAWAYSANLEEYTTARQLAMEAWRLFQQAGDRWYVTHLTILGYSAECEGDYPKARQYFEEAFSIFKEVNDTHGMEESLRHIGYLELASDPYHAKYYLKEVIKLQHQKSQSGYSLDLYTLGSAEVMLCQSLPLAERKFWLRRAARLFGAAEVIGGTEWQGHKIWLKHYPPALALLRSQLEADELAAVWAEGAAMPEDEVYKYALEEDDATHARAENP